MDFLSNGDFGILLVDLVLNCFFGDIFNILLEDVLNMDIIINEYKNNWVIDMDVWILDSGFLNLNLINLELLFGKNLIFLLEYVVCVCEVF